MRVRPAPGPGSHLPSRFAVAALRSGGCWHEVVALDDERIGVAVGQVSGPPPATGQLVRRLRAVLVAGHGADRAPAAVVRELHGVAVPGAALDAVLCATLDAARGELRWSGSGSLSPLLVDAEGAAYLPGTTAPIAPGTTAVLHTAGLVGPAGTAPLAAAAAAGHGLDPALLAGSLVEPAPADAALVVVRVVPPPLEERLPADARRLPVVRRALRRWSELAGLSDDTIADMELLLSEAVTNAVEHAYGDGGTGEFVYSVHRRGDGAIRVLVRDFGRWRPPPPDPGYRGRGLALINTLSDRVELEAGDAGTCIVFTVNSPTRAGDGIG